MLEAEETQAATGERANMCGERLALPFDQQVLLLLLLLE
jgi:hypothetical protein